MLISLIAGRTNDLKSQSERYEFTELLKEAYFKSTNLELQGASYLLNTSIEQDPYNLLNNLIADYIDFFKIFVNQDETFLKALEPNKTNRLNRINHSKINSPYRLYTLAEINLHWGLIYLQNGSYLSAYAHIKRAYKYLSKNVKLYPAFISNYKSLSILHATVGSIPKQFRSVFSFFSGMRGTIEQGRKEMSILIEYIEDHPEYLFRDETYSLYSLLLMHLNNAGEEAWEVIQNFEFGQIKSPLIVFAQVNVAMRTYRNEEALRLLNSHNPQQSQMTFHYLDFLKGLALLRKLDFNAKNYFQQFIQKAPGANYKKEAFQKLGWLALIDNDLPTYQNMLLKIEQVGDDQIDGDKNALKEARDFRKGIVPNVDLLKARLLFDGGYFSESRKLLLSDQEKLEQNERLDLEYHYRLSRTYHMAGNLPQALKYYQLTIKKGINSPTYFACNSALQMGLIYESIGDFSKAIKYYRFCLDIYPEDYSNSLHIKAESGLNRVKGKGSG